MPQLRIGFIGAGKVGTAFGIYLKQHGCRIQGYADKSLAIAETAAKLTDSQVYGDLAVLVNDCDLLLITTPDDRISDVCMDLAEQGVFRQNQYIGHMSGACTTEILMPARKQGAVTFSLHPLQSFASVDAALSLLPATYFSLEGEHNELNPVKEIIDICGNPCVELTAAQKPLYHAGASVLSNFLVTLIDYGLNYYRTIGLNPEVMLEALFPLIEGTIANIKLFGPEKALTGPIVRGDCETVRKHLASLQAINPELLNTYVDLAKRTLDLATTSGRLDAEHADELHRLLAE